MHAISSYRGNRPTNKHSHTQTGSITIHCAAASAQCNYRSSTCLRNTHTHTHTHMEREREQNSIMLPLIWSPNRRVVLALTDACNSYIRLMFIICHTPELCQKSCYTALIRLSSTFHHLM